VYTDGSTSTWSLVVRKRTDTSRVPADEAGDTATRVDPFDCAGITFEPNHT